MKKVLRVTEQALGIFFFSTMFLAVTVQIFSRYVLNTPLTWPPELAVYSFIYMIYIGSALASRRGSHVVFDVLFRRLPARAQAVLNLTTNAFLIIVILSAFPGGISYIRMVGTIRSSALNLPWTFILLSFLIGMGLVIIHLSGWMVIYAREIMTPEKP